MSSHHIVRENQEPALIVDSINDLSEEYIGQLLEWSPTIFVSEQALNYFLQRDIKVDFLISNNPQVQPLQQDIKVLPLEKGIITDALEYLCSNDYKAANIISSIIPKNIEEYCQRINLVVFSEQRKYVCVCEKYEKWQIKGAKIFVDHNAIVSMKGLKTVGESVLESIDEGFFSLILEPGKYITIGEEI